MNSINVTWERVIDADGTVYCCWLFTIHNCKDEETFRILALIAGILCVIIFAINSGSMLWRYVNKEIAGDKGYLRTLIFVDLALLFAASFCFALYADSFPDAYGFLLAIMIIIFIGMAGVTFTIQVMKLTSELSIHEPIWILRIIKFLQLMELLLTGFRLIIAIVFCHLINIGSAAAEPVFQTFIACTTITYGASFLINLISLTQLFRKIDSMSSHLSSEIGQRQVKLVKLFSITILGCILVLTVGSIIIGAVKDLFKIFELSVFFFVGCFIGSPFVALMIMIGIFIMEYQKKALSDNRSLLGESFDVYSNNLQSHNLTDY